MDWQIIGMLAMAGTTFIMAFWTAVNVFSDKKSHEKDRETDALMHTYEHIISLAHLEAEHLHGLTPETKEMLDKIRKDRLETVKKGRW